MENFPDKNLGDLTNGGWDINMAYLNNGKKYNIINARKDNLFFTLCSAALADNSDNIYVSYQQNEIWRDYYDLNLGKALGKKSEIAPNIYQRKFTNGTITLNAKRGTAKVKYRDGTVRIDIEGDVTEQTTKQTPKKTTPTKTVKRK